jgi:hypothetical protein
VQVDDQQLEAMCKAQEEHYAGNGAWTRDLTGNDRESRMASMRVALATLPDLAADLAACRMERDHWLQRATELEQALACPDRETLAKALRDTWWGDEAITHVQPDPWDKLSSDDKGEYERLADCALAMCAGRLPVAVWDVAEYFGKLAEASEISVVRDAYLDCKEELEDALKPATQASLLPIPTSDNKPVLLKPATPEPQAPNHSEPPNSSSDARAAIERLTAVTDAHRRALEGMRTVFESVAGSFDHNDTQQLAVDLDCAIRDALDARKAKVGS